MTRVLLRIAALDLLGVAAYLAYSAAWFAADALSKWGNPDWEFLPELDVYLGLAAGGFAILEIGFAIAAWRAEARWAGWSAGVGGAIPLFIALLAQGLDRSWRLVIVASGLVPLAIGVLAIGSTIPSALRRRVP